MYKRVGVGKDVVVQVVDRMAHVWWLIGDVLAPWRCGGSLEM